MQEQVACSEFFLSVEPSVFLLPAQRFAISIHAHEANQLCGPRAALVLTTIILGIKGWMWTKMRCVFALGAENPPPVYRRERRIISLGSF